MNAAPDSEHTARDEALSELGHRGGALAVGGVPAEQLAERFGTPLYAFDAGVAVRRLARLRAALGPRVEVLYALKANPSVLLARALHRAGAGAEVASAGELAVAAAAGVPGERIQFAGPGKGPADFAAAFAAGVSALNLESAAEYEALAAAARARGVRPGVAIRVNPRATTSGARMRMGGGSQRFGVDAGDVLPLAGRIVAEDAVDLRGLHVYAGTQCFDADAWLAQARALSELCREVERALGRELATLNLGGGFGVPTFAGDPRFDLERAGRGVQDLVAQDARPARRWFVEPGRWLVAPCGVYLTRVRYAKRSAGRDHVVLDGGLHHHGAAAGVGAVVKRPFPIVLARDPLALPARRYTLGGPLCTPADEFAADLELPELAPGDLIAVLVAGAYGLTYSSTRFLSHPAPAEVVVAAGTARLARAPGRPDDALRDQVLDDDAPTMNRPDPDPDLRERIARLVSRVILQTTGRSVLPGPDDPLFARTGVDPFLIQNLVFELGLEFQVALPLTELHEHNFGTVAKITDMVARRLPSRLDTGRGC